MRGAFIILSRYSQGFDGYQLAALKGDFAPQGLPNMFAVSGYDDIQLSFHYGEMNPKETSDNTPTYKITIHTKGFQDDDGVINYDEKTASEAEPEKHNPNIMPKIIKENQEVRDDEMLSPAPLQNIEPPNGD